MILKFVNFKQKSILNVDSTVFVIYTEYRRKPDAFTVFSEELQIDKG